MNKINVTKAMFNTIYGLGILAILTFGIVIVPIKVSAQYYDGSRVSGYNPPRFVDESTHTQSQYNSSQGIIYSYPQENTIVPVFYSSNTNPNTSNSTQNSNSNNNPNTTNNSSVDTSTNETNTPSALAANAVFGSNGFAPSGLIQWVLVAILILFIVIIVRKVFGSKDNYHSTPMKHA